MNRQEVLRSDLEAWESYINYLHSKRRVAQPMLELAMGQRSSLLKLLLKVQTEEYDRS